MASNVDIANIALSLLGHEEIASLTADLPRARLVNRFFGPSRDAVLREHPWNCAVTRVTLAQLADAPTHGWAYNFQLPADCLRVLGFNDDEEAGEESDRHKVEGRTIVSDHSTCNIRYVKQMTDPTQMDPMLYTAIAFRLAADMAYAITRDKSVADAMWTLYEERIRKARTVDGQEGSPDYRGSSVLTRDR
jgi:hypothetical protein